MTTAHPTVDTLAAALSGRARLLTPAESLDRHLAARGTTLDALGIAWADVRAVDASAPTLRIDLRDGTSRLVPPAATA